MSIYPIFVALVVVILSYTSSSPLGHLFSMSNSYIENIVYKVLVLDSSGIHFLEGSNVKPFN
ncbi:hypothetical protein M758_11G161000 [Ceratodon purpureus]|uniref:Uncharacterized protein n=1 Tax=Ceratodon purpureus TaxID=3225 RepID=A0A8T0GER3_CERPU|nr:hypothetical protein KC19_11G165200 [Ceratodon purpureus]KAG0602109.1 hypothetical protein M758_11G161000 [Ceratodon purpureus]